MPKPVNQIQMTADQLNQAVQVWLNEHVFKDEIIVFDVKVEGYGADRCVKIDLADGTSPDNG